MALVFIMLFTGFIYFTSSSNRLRMFNVSNSEHDWNASLQAHVKNNESFVTLYDEEDLKVTKNLSTKSCWIGLHKGRKPTWSDSVPLTFSKTTVNVTNGEQRCEAIVNNNWEDFSCSDMRYFMCYKGNDYTLIEKKKNWCQALQYCRKHFTDLVSISSATQNDEVIKQGKNTSFWIGLLHDEWEWQDKGCSSFREWRDSRDPDSEHKCTAQLLGTDRKMEKYDCINQIFSYTSTGTTRIRVIEKPLTWEQAFDYCRAHHTGLLWIEGIEDQMAVKQWLNYTTAPESGPFWIGLRQSRVFGFWIWSSDRIVKYSNWNNSVPKLPMSNHCGVISRANYKWTDENCLVPLHFLCEEEIVFMNK